MPTDRPALRLPGNAPYKQGVIVGAVMGAVVAGFFVWAGGFPDGHGDARKPSPTAVSRSASASASPLPQKPAKDPVADIEDQEVNTATVMTLPACTNGDVRPSARSAHNSYGSGDKVRIKLTISAADGGTAPCRVDAARDHVSLTLTAADSESPLWDSSACASKHAAHRWIKVTRSLPAFVNFVWDRIPNDSDCRQKTHAAAGTYLVENTLLGKKTQTSFVLDAETTAKGRFSPSPSVEATGNAGTTTGSSSTSGGSGDGFFGGNDSQTPSKAPSSQSVSTTPSGANGANGGGSNGSANGGLFGGST